MTIKHGEILSAYIACEPVRSICEKFSVSWQTVYNIVKAAGLKPRRITIRKFTMAQREEIRTLYTSGKSTHELAKMFNVSRPGIFYVLQRHVKTRPNIRFKKTCKIDESAFDDLTEASAYWLGFFMADGHVRDSQQPSIELHLAKKDRKHVEAFRCFLKADHKIWEGKVSSRLQVRSRVLVDKLAIYGIGFSGFRCPSIELMENRHFWRGMIDGDGGVRIGKFGPGTNVAQIYFTGNEAIVKGFLAFAKKFVVTRRNPSRIKRCVSPTFQLSFSHRAAQILAAILYSDCSVYLDRKKAIADRIMALK